MGRPVSMTVGDLGSTQAEGMAPDVTGEMVFLDFQATTPLDPKVVEAMLPWMGGAWNAHATEHRLGRMAADAIEEAREKVARLFGCSHSEVIFTSGATEASNIVLRGVTAPGDGLAISAVEHASVRETAYALEAEGRSVLQVAVDDDGIIDLDALEAALDSRPALVSVMAVNNEIGTVQPVQEAATLCADSGVPLHSDMAQAAGRTPLSLRSSPVSYASISAHKIYGPQGVGALFIRDGADAPRPLYTGGGQENGLRPGTLPVAACVGFGAACDLAMSLRQRDFDNAATCTQVMLDGLADLDGWQVNGTLEDRIPHNLSIAFDGVDADVLLASLPGLALATGSACNSGSLKRSDTLTAIGLPDDLAGGTVRVGFGRTTTVEQVRGAARLLRGQVSLLRRANA